MNADKWGEPIFKSDGGVILLPIIVHINELSMEKILYIA